MGFSKVRAYLLLQAEQEGEITGWFTSNTQESKIRVSLFVCGLVEDHTVTSICETGSESNKFSPGETN